MVQINPFSELLVVLTVLCSSLINAGQLECIEQAHKDLSFDKSSHFERTAEKRLSDVWDGGAWGERAKRDTVHELNRWYFVELLDS